MLKKKEIINKLMNARQMTLINYNDSDWKPESCLIIWKSKDGKNEIIINVDDLEWTFK